MNKDERKNKWIYKYSPKKFSDIIGHKNKIDEMEKWINDFIEEKPGTKKCLLITGNSGIGKTIIARILLKKYNYSIIEHQCDEIKGSKNIYSVIKQSLVYTNILDSLNETDNYIGLILDQINVLAEGGINRSGLLDLINIFKDDIDNYSKNKKKKYIYFYNPIICICQKVSSKLKKLLKYVKHIHLDEYNEDDLLLKIKPILKDNKIKINKSALKHILNYSNKDYRRFVNILEEAYNIYGPNKMSVKNIKLLQNIYSNKNKRYTNVESINDLMTKYMSISDSIDIFYNNHYLIPYYMYDNYLLFLNKYKISIKEKINLYYNLLRNSCEYEYLDNNYDNRYENNFNYYSQYCSSIPNLLCSKYSHKYIKKDITNEIQFPKLYTILGTKSINNKYMYFDFNNIYIINFIHYHLFNKNGDKKKLLEFIKKYNINNIDTLIKYKKMFISFESQNINKITKNIKKNI